MMVFRVSQISGATPQNHSRFTDLSGFEDQPTIFQAFERQGHLTKMNVDFLCQDEMAVSPTPMGFFLSNQTALHISRTLQAGKG